MEKYRLVEKRTGVGKEFLEKGSYCEIRIRQQGKPKNYISFAMEHYTRGSEEVILKAMGRAISKAITVAEILKRRMPLYQLNTFTTLEMIDVFEPIEEGLDIVTSTRHVACLRITLSRTGRGIDPNAVGFQPPLPFDMHGTEYYGMPPQPTQYHPSSII